MSTQSINIPDRQQTTCTEHNGVCDAPICGWLCVSEPAVCNPPSFAAGLCVTDPPTLRTEMLGPFGMNMTTSTTRTFPTFCVSCTPKNLDIRQHANHANNATTPLSSTSSSGPHNARVASLWCSAVASCCIGGCCPSSVITISLASAVLLCMCAVCRVVCVAKNNSSTT